MAFIKTYYDHDQHIARQKQVYGRIKSLELFEKEARGHRYDSDHTHVGRLLGRQRVLYQLDQSLLNSQESRKSSKSLFQKLMSFFQRPFKVFN